MSKDGIRKWTVLEREELLSCRVFSVHRRRSRSESTGRTDDFFVLESPDWVNVIALTRGGEVVLVEQYRHGTDVVTLELPGGMIDPGDGGPVPAGVRELREETGFTGVRPRLIGTVHPNPSIQTNLCHTLLLEEAERTSETSFDPNEELATRIIPLVDIPDLVRSGAIVHSLVVAAFHHLELRRPEPPGQG
jgi:8-oxo-dGTP pyrophosphatase MutT (NUDIX family)